MPKKDLSLNKVSELCEKIKGEKYGVITLTSSPYFSEKCPSHELLTPTWSDKLGQYPNLKESDVMDVYVFVNGMPWQRK